MRKLCWSLGLPLLLALAAQPAQAQDSDEASIVSVQIENDVFTNTDRHYTNGFRATWLSGDLSVPEWTKSINDWIPLLSERRIKRVAVSVGQSLFTASDIRDPDPPADERPYAGWLYGSLGFVSLDREFLESWSLDLGVVGPSAVGETTQKTVHRWINSPQPQGWDGQLDNEPGIAFSYQIAWKNPFTGGQPLSAGLEGLGLGPLEVELIPNAGFTLGNVFTDASVGATVRIGFDLPEDFGPPRIRPAPTGTTYFAFSPDFEVYLFGGVTARAVARNIFLDGNTFSDSRSVDKEPFVGDLQFGIAATWRDYRLAFTNVLRTREFEAQEEPDNFGAITLSARF